jgi:asparagine synthase (glutamine-hydrolysing)
MWHQEEPFTSTSIYAQWAVMRLAQDAGVTVLLDGQGGDESLGGYFRYFGNLFRDLIARFRLIRLSQEVRAYLQVHGRKRLRVVAFGLLPEVVSQGLRRHLRQVGIHPAMERDNFSPFVREERRFNDVVNQALFETLRRGIYHLVRYADRNSMAFSREVRLPFLDHRVVEFLLSLPPEEKIGQGMTKLILRRAMQGKMPEKVRLRTSKLGFTPPEKLWFQQQALRDWMLELLHSKSLAQRGWVDVETVRRVSDEHWSGRRDWTNLLWQWISVELWARTFLD